MFTKVNILKILQISAFLSRIFSAGPGLSTVATENNPAGSTSKRLITGKFPEVRMLALRQCRLLSRRIRRYFKA